MESDSSSTSDNDDKNSEVNKQLDTPNPHVVQYVEDLSDSADEIINELGQKIVNEVMENAVIELEEQFKNDAEDIDNNELTESHTLVTDEIITEEKTSIADLEPPVEIISGENQKNASQSSEVVSNETEISNSAVTVNQPTTENSQPDLDSPTAVQDVILKESVVPESVKEEKVANEPAEETFTTVETTNSEPLDKKFQQNTDTSSVIEKVEEIKNESVEPVNPQDEVTIQQKLETELEIDTIDNESLVADEPLENNFVEPWTGEIVESESQTVTESSNENKLGINDMSSALAYVTLLLNDCAIEKSLPNFRIGFLNILD